MAPIDAALAEHRILAALHTALLDRGNYRAVRTGFHNRYDVYLADIYGAKEVEFKLHGKTSRRFVRDRLERVPEGDGRLDVLRLTPPQITEKGQRAKLHLTLAVMATCAAYDPARIALPQYINASLDVLDQIRRRRASATMPFHYVAGGSGRLSDELRAAFLLDCEKVRWYDVRDVLTFVADRYRNKTDTLEPAPLVAIRKSPAGCALHDIAPLPANQRDFIY